MTPRLWRNPFVREPGDLQTVVSRETLPGIGLLYVTGEPVRRERTVVVHYSGGHQAYDSVPA